MRLECEWQQNVVTFSARGVVPCPAYRGTQSHHVTATDAMDVLSTIRSWTSTIGGSSRCSTCDRRTRFRVEPWLRPEMERKSAIAAAAPTYHDYIRGDASQLAPDELDRTLTGLETRIRNTLPSRVGR